MAACQVLQREHRGSAGQMDRALRISSGSLALSKRTDFQVLSSILGHEQTQKGKHRATAFQDLHQGRADGTVSGTGGQHSASYDLDLGSVDQKSDVRAGPVPDNKVVAVPHSPF